MNGSECIQHFFYADCNLFLPVHNRVPTGSGLRLLYCGSTKLFLSCSHNGRSCRVLAGSVGVLAGSAGVLAGNAGVLAGRNGRRCVSCGGEYPLRLCEKAALPVSTSREGSKSKSINDGTAPLLPLLLPTFSGPRRLESDLTWTSDEAGASNGTEVARSAAAGCLLDE